MMMSLLPTNAVFAATSGTCGENLTWTIDNNGKLTISGTGNMYGIPKSLSTSIKSVVINDGVTNICSQMFEDCTGLRSITIPNSVTSIENRAFKGCTGLKSITIQSGVTSIGKNAFKNCTSLTSVIIPGSVKSIAGFAFESCTGLASVNIQDGVTSIGGNAFSGCTGLKSVTIGNSVAEIGNCAFLNCTGLKTVYYKGTAADWNRISIDSNNTKLINAKRIYLGWTKTTISNNGKSFAVTPKNIEGGVTVIIALYNGNQLVEVQSAVYSGNEISFNTKKTYTNVKVMTWGSLGSMTPISDVEFVK